MPSNLFVVFVAFNYFLTGKSCVVPSGLGVGLGLVNPADVTINFQTYLAFLASDNELTPEIEDPIEFRFTNWVTFGIMNALITFDDTALDSWARVDVTNSRRKCLTGVTQSEIQQHLSITQAYILYFGLRAYYDFEKAAQVQQELDNIMVGAGLDPNICEDVNFDCSDISTPWGCAFVSAQEIIEWGKVDGWNADGSYNRQVNQVPFEDWRYDPYIPSNDPWRLLQQKRWQPLKESDLLGFIYYQEHVLPHIGFTGRLMYLDPDYYCSLEAPDPNYNYNLESEVLFERLRTLDDVKKAQIELFDDKSPSIIRLILTYWIIQQTIFTPQFWVFQSGVFDVMYESTLIVWRQKVLHDRVRPTSIIRKLFENETITTYGGATLQGASRGTQTFKGADFEPYIRTMPHAEYPSGSACICEATIEYLKTYLGFDNFLTEPTLGFPLSLTWPAFSSKKEPVTTPIQDVTLHFTSWSQVSEVCGQSRLDGGMHFTASVETGRELCRESGRIIGEAYLRLREGLVPDYVADFNDRELKQDICADNDDEETSPDDTSESD